MIDHFSQGTDHLFTLGVNCTVERTVANDKWLENTDTISFFLSNYYMPEMILILQVIIEPMVNLVVSNLILLTDLTLL